MNRPPSFGQHFRIGSSASENLISGLRPPVCRFPQQVHYFLAGPFFRMLRPRMQQIQSLFEQAPSFSQICRRFRFENELNLLRKIFHAAHLQRHRHALPRSQRIDRQRKLRRFAIDSRLLEEQRLSTAGRFHLAIRPFADNQVGLDRDGNASQLALLVERVDELPKRSVSHGATVSDGREIRTKVWREPSGRAGKTYCFFPPSGIKPIR